MQIHAMLELKKTSLVLQFCGVTLCLLLSTVTAHAEAPKQNAAMAQALQKTQGLLRQLSQEKNQLATEKTALEEKVKKLETEVSRIAPLQAEIEHQKTSLSSLESANGALSAQLNTSREKYQALLQKHKDVIAQAKQIQSDNQHLVRAVKEREQWIGECQEKNKGLIEADHELVDKFKDKGFWEKLGELEPFTGIGKIESETTVHNYQFKLEDLKVTPFVEQSKAQGSDKAYPKAEPQQDTPDDENKQNIN